MSLFPFLVFIMLQPAPSPPTCAHKSQHAHTAHCGSIMTACDFIFINSLSLRHRWFYSHVLLVRRWKKREGAKEGKKEGRFGGWRLCRSKHVRHNGRTGVSEGSCFILFEGPNESTPVLIPINPKGPDCHGSLGSLDVAQESKHCSRKRKGKERSVSYQPWLWLSWEFLLFFFIFDDSCT